MSFPKDSISDKVWDLKYRYRHRDLIIDQTIEDTWRRVANAIAKAEKHDEQSHWQNAFYRILENFQFLPGGRILAGAGTQHKVTLFNCFVMNIGSDSLTAIFDALREGALTLQRGGGVGYDFSILRPKGDLVKKTGIGSSGPVSFMRIWDTTCKVLLSTGARRGAMMAVLRCDHPDIEEFVTAKEDPQELRHFNVSVMISDAFMEAVKKDEEWPLIFPIDEDTHGHQEIIYRRWGQSIQPVPCRIYRKIKARDLWNKIIRSAYDYAEPGVLFGDTINRMNNLWYCEYISATNPCGEIPLPPYGACNLGAINLTQFVTAPFSANAQMNWSRVEEVVRIATRFQDDVVDVSEYPLDVQRQQSIGTRRIGLGMTGLADALVMLGIKYGGADSIKVANDIMKKIAEITWETSIELAQEKGKFPFYNEDYLHGQFVCSLDERIQAKLKRHGVRNSHHNTIAPAGTISLLANNISNGIEPIFKGDYNRHVRSTDEEILTFHVKDYALQRWHENNSGLPAAWVDTDSLTPLAHLQIQAAVQPYIDNAISKTINIPAHFPFEKLQDVYSQAYEMGLKGCTVFRPNMITGSVLEAKPPEEEDDRCCPHEC